MGKKTVFIKAPYGAPSPQLLEVVLIILGLVQVKGAIGQVKGIGRKKRKVDMYLGFDLMGGEAGLDGGELFFVEQALIGLDLALPQAKGEAGCQAFAWIEPVVQAVYLQPGTHVAIAAIYRRGESQAIISIERRVQDCGTFIAVDKSGRKRGGDQVICPQGKKA